jgi:F420-dependent oxidoreductase-like protein
MKFGAAFWTHRTGWPDLRDACRAAEEAGFETVWVDDHLLADEGVWTDPKLEGWATLAALASITTKVRLGLLVGANTFRNPGLTAKLATTLDHVSGGRAILGIGGGWFAREHEAFGLPFGRGFGERLDRLDEAVMLIRRLLDGERVTHDGRFYQMREAICLPRPLQERMPIMIGGSGPTKTLRTTARFADMWNGYGEAQRIEATSAVLRERCAEIGRPFDAIARTVTMDVVIRDSADAAKAEFAEISARHGIEGRAFSDGTPRGLNAGGPPDLVADYLRPFADLGVAEVMWIFRWPFDRESIGGLPEVRARLA